MTTWERLSKAGFEIGGEDQLAVLRERHPQPPDAGDDVQRQRLQEEWEESSSKVQIQSGTLLKTDTVSFLLGAGASKESPLHLWWARRPPAAARSGRPS